MELLEKLKYNFKNGNAIIRLIYINVAIYIVVALIGVVVKLFNWQMLDVSTWLSLPSDINLLLSHIWTPLTYMFYHERIMHILFNMLMLFWFGRIFLIYFSEKQLVAIYLFGGLFGALFYLLGYNFLPYFQSVAAHSILLGASGAIMAIVVASALKAPDMELQLLLLGRIKLMWIAIASVLISFFGLTSDNAGGEMAHLGGALGGYLFFAFDKKNRDITIYITRVIDFFVNLFRPRPKIKKTTYHASKMSPEAYNQSKAKNDEEVDRILDKIKFSGYESLTKEEKRKLFEQKK